MFYIITKNIWRLIKFSQIFLNFTKKFLEILKIFVQFYLNF